MPYAVITVEGVCTLRPEQATAALVREVVEGGVEVARGAPGDLVAQVDGDGFVRGLPRNIVGSVTLWCLGFPEQPYAGPIVVTGWDPDGLPTETCDIPPHWQDIVPRIARDVRVALELEDGPASQYAPDWWLANVRQAAVLCEQAPTPTMQVMSVTLGEDGRFEMKPVED